MKKVPFTFHYDARLTNSQRIRTLESRRGGPITISGDAGRGKPEACAPHPHFVTRIYFVIRHSDFVIVRSKKIGRRALSHHVSRLELPDC